MSLPNPIEALMNSGQTVWAIDELRQIWQEDNPDLLKSKVAYYIKKKRLLRLSKGIYVLNKNYNPLELAQKLQTPSYISLDTALRQKGIIQQYAEEITCIGTYPRVYQVDGKTIHYHQMDRALLSYPIGILKTATYNIALPERAIIDCLYFGFQPDVANYSNWDTRMLRKLEKEYALPRVTKGLQEYQLLS